MDTGQGMRDVPERADLSDGAPLTAFDTSSKPTERARAVHSWEQERPVKVTPGEAMLLKLSTRCDICGHLRMLHDITRMEECPESCYVESVAREEHIYRLEWPD